MIVNYFLKSNYPVDYQGNYDAQESKIRYIYIIVLHMHSKILLIELDQRKVLGVLWGFLSWAYFIESRVCGFAETENGWSTLKYCSTLEIGFVHYNWELEI